MLTSQLKCLQQIIKAHWVAASRTPQSVHNLRFVAPHCCGASITVCMSLPSFLLFLWSSLDLVSCSALSFFSIIDSCIGDDSDTSNISGGGGVAFSNWYFFNLAFSRHKTQVNFSLCSLEQWAGGYSVYPWAVQHLQMQSIVGLQNTDLGCWRRISPDQPQDSQKNYVNISPSSIRDHGTVVNNVHRWLLPC